MIQVLFGAVVLAACIALLWFSRPTDGKKRTFLANELVEIGVAVTISLGIAFGVAQMTMGFV